MQAPSISVPQALEFAEALRRSGQLEAAETLYRRITTSVPTCFDAWNNLGNALSEKREFEASIECFQRAIALSPNFGSAHNNLGLTLQEAGRISEAATCFWRAVEIDPDNAEWHVNLSLPLFLTGRHEEGWNHYEWRLRNPQGAAGFEQLRAPQWRGDRMPGETLLILTEQGLGDTLQFIRYLPLIQSMSEARLVFAHRRNLRRLLANQLPANVATVVPPVGLDITVNNLPPFDRYIPLLSCPPALRCFEPLTMAEPYLHPDPALVESWRIGSSHVFRVGLAWEGNSSHPRDRHRSIAFEKMLPLLERSDAEFYSLQIHSPIRHERLIDWTNRIADLADTAALISQLDLVITVDTAVAHLAGSMGKPVWTLLPFVPDWRWGLEREDTPWYPAMRLFRQKHAGDWPEVIQRVAGELRAW